MLRDKLVTEYGGTWAKVRLCDQGKDQDICGLGCGLTIGGNELCYQLKIPKGKTLEGMSEINLCEECWAHCEDIGDGQ